MEHERIAELMPSLKLHLCSPQGTDIKSDMHSPVYSEGIVQLCKGVSAHGSLNLAAKECHMSYSKAWKLIKNAEEALGFCLISRDSTRGSSLTQEGEFLLNAYVGLEEHLNSCAQEW